MSLFVTQDSACWYWRHANDYSLTLSLRCEGTWNSNLEGKPTPSELSYCVATIVEKPIHLLVPSVASRVQKTQYCYHVCSKEIPADLFCHIEKGIFVASPELALAQMAKRLSPVEFVELSMEFMGMYALRESVDRGFVTRRDPLVSRQRLTLALSIVLGKRLFRQMSLFLEYAEYGSRSPMETREFLLLTLPKRYGGYGLPKPRINERIELTPSQQAETGRRYVECDLLWPEQGISVEYDGGRDHASFEARAKDATKRNVLHALGLRQFTITACQIFDAEAFDAIARDIARALGVRLKDFPEDWGKRRAELRNLLFQSMQRNG